MQLALHVPNVHRWVYDRAEHMLDYYGGLPVYEREIEICERSMEWIERNYNYPARDAEELFLYESDNEEGEHRRPPSRIIPQCSFSGVVFAPSPTPSRAMIARRPDNRVLDRHVQAMITERQVVITHDERRNAIREMEFQPQNVIMQAPYFNVSNNMCDAPSNVPRSQPPSHVAPSVSNVREEPVPPNGEELPTETYRELFGHDAEAVARLFGADVDAVYGQQVVSETQENVAVYNPETNPNSVIGRYGVYAFAICSICPIE